MPVDFDPIQEDIPIGDGEHVPEHHEVWVDVKMLHESVQALYEEIETCHEVEDVLFQHVRDILGWKESIDNLNLPHLKEEVY